MWRKRDGSVTRLEFRERLDDDPAMIEPEDTMESKGTLAWLGLALTIAGVIPALWAAGELSEGLVALPRHWWSALATLPLALGIVLTTAALLRAQRPGRHA